ncbi:MAG: GH116 family glycosyl-hydrolase, partial [Planctomycetota bacterium]
MTLRLLTLVSILAAVAPVRGGEPAPTRMTWPIPAVAWRVPIGGLDRGVPVGGVGAGSVMVNAGGSFGPWHFRVGEPELDRRLPAAAFHFYEKAADQPARVTTLTARRLMPAWSALPPNAGFYHALYPKGWFTFRCFTAELSLKFFSPILKGAARETSYPVAVFEFVMANPTDQPLEAAVLFTFPNAAGHRTELRSGFLNVVETDPERRIISAVLDANYEGNHPAAQDTEWCIAVRAEHDGEATYLASWNALASGGDVLAEFADDGRLPNRALDATDSAAAVAFRTTLPPKATATVPFALSWDFPRHHFPAAQWWRRYTEHLGRSADNARALATEALLRHAEWEAAIDAWQRPIIEDDAYPLWLRQAALNELYYDSFGGVFWEAGCITEPREFNNLDPDDHKYATLASAARPLCEPLALHAAAAPHLRALWPHIEREVLATYADVILAAPQPAVHDLGTAADSPFLACDAEPHPEAHDLPALFILQVWAHYQATEDREFLDHVWRACLK